MTPATMPNSREIAVLARAIFNAEGPRNMTWDEACANRQPSEYFDRASRIALAMHAHGHSINA